MALLIVYMEKMNNNVIITNVPVSTCANEKRYGIPQHK